MGIKFRHDAAAVVPPTNSANRKYGQSLVLQQNQQKYNAQQAGYDRLFQLGRDFQQNAFQVGRDNADAVRQQLRDARLAADQNERDKAQQDFLLERDKAQFAQEDKQANLKSFAAGRDLIGQRAQKMLDSGQITDPALAAEIRSLLEGKRIVTGSNFSADEQQEFLNKYSEELAGKLSQVPPPPTPEEQLISQIGEEKYAQYGHLYEQDEKGRWKFSKDLADREDKQREREEAMRPKSFEEHYDDKKNPGAFDKGLDAAKSSLQEEEDARAEAAKEKPKQITKEQALEQMQKDYAFKQKVFGKVGEPTPAPKLQGARTEQEAYDEYKAAREAALDPGTGYWKPGATDEMKNRYIAAHKEAKRFFPSLEKGSTQLNEEVAANSDPSKRTERSILEGSPTPAAPITPPAPASPPSETQSILEASPQSPSVPASPPASTTPPRTDWADTMAASGGQPTPALPTPAAPQASAGQPTPAAPSQAAAVPDFGSLMAGTKKPEDRQLYNALRGMYGSQPPDVQAAINAVVDSGGTDGAFLAAKQYLKSKGIDIDQLAMPTVPGGGRKGRAK